MTKTVQVTQLRAGESLPCHQENILHTEEWEGIEDGEEDVLFLSVWYVKENRHE